MLDVSERVKSDAPKIYSKDLMELVFRYPYSRIRFIEEAGIAQRKTASVYLRELEHLGVLRGVKIGRELYYINDAFLALLIG